MVIYQKQFNKLNQSLSDTIGIEYQDITITENDLMEDGLVYSDSFKGKLNPFYGQKHSQTTKKKLSEQRMGDKNPFYGKKFTEEAIEKMRQKATGRKHSDETRKKLSEGRIGKEPWNKGKKGVQVPWNKGLKIKKDSA